MEPAPSPKGTAHIHNQIKSCEQENPRRAMAAIVVLIAVTLAVPNLAINLELERLDITVPMEMTAEI